jgi:hypothetical protein
MAGNARPFATARHDADWQAKAKRRADRRPDPTTRAGQPPRQQGRIVNDLLKYMRNDSSMPKQNEQNPGAGNPAIQDSGNCLCQEADSCLNPFMNTCFP